MKLSSLLPDADAVVLMAPEELAGVIIELMLPVDKAVSGNILSADMSATDPGYPRERWDEISQAFFEAWAWLEGQGMLVWPDAMNGQIGWRTLSRRARELGGRDGMAAYRHAALLPKELLHEEITKSALVSFQRGDYDTAVFQAFKKVEITVRDVGGFEDADHGVVMIRKAFAPDTGPLSDASKPRSEQEALMHLFAGSIGSYKNPHSHRDVRLDTVDAVEMLMLASHLLRIVDSLQSD